MKNNSLGKKISKDDKIVILKNAIPSFLIITIFAIIFAITILHIYNRAEIQSNMDVEQHIVEMPVMGIIQDIRDIYLDVIILANQKHIEDLWKEDKTVDQNILHELSENFLAISKLKKQYDQVRLIDENGLETIRINYNNGSPYIVSKENLQNKKGRYYFDDVFNLQKNEIFVSPLDLNIEHGKVEKPLKPMIRVGTPIFNKSGKKSGIVLLNYFGADLIDHCKNYFNTSKKDNIMLLNSDGYWLCGVNPDNEWGFMFKEKKDRTFGNKFPKAWEKINSQRSGQFENQAGLFTFETIFPLAEGQILSTGTDEAFSASQSKLNSKDYYWKIVSLLPTNYFKHNSNKRLLTTIYSLIALSGLFLYISILFSINRFYRRISEDKIRKSEEELRLLTKTMKDVIISISLKGELLYVSPSIEQFGGYRAEEEIGNHFSKYFSKKKELQRAIKLISEVVSTHEGGIFEFMFKPKNKNPFWVEHTYMPIIKANKVSAIQMTLRDITKRKKEEEILHLSNRVLETTFDHISVIGKDYKYKYVNTAYTKAHGLSKNQIVGNSVSDLLGNDLFNDFIKPKLDRCFSGEDIFFSAWFDFKISHKKYMAVSYLPLISSDGKIDSLTVISRDITKRKLTEKKLREAKQQFDLALEGANAGSWSWNIKTGEDLMDERWCGILGYRHDEIEQVVDTWERLIHPDDKERVMNVREKNLKDDRFEYKQEYRMKCKNGEWKWILALGKVVERDADGNPIKKTGIIIDINQRKLAEEENVKLSTAIKQSSSIIVVTDTNGNIEYVNPRFIELTGYTIEEVLGQNPRILKSSNEPNEIYKELWETISSGKEWRGEFHNKKKNGKLFWEFASISPLFNKQGKIINYIKVAEDVSLKKKTDLELTKMERLRSIGTLAGGIAHDFNNILSGIYGYVSLALVKMDKNHPSYHYLAETEKSINRVTQLTRQLLTFSKGGSPIKKDVNLRKVIEETVIFDLSGSNVKPVFNFAENIMYANVDKSQIHQVFSNLTINANQASPNGGHLYISVANCFVGDGEILDLKSGEYLKITVQDEGIGIPQKNIDKIFDPYFTTKATGSGLGLATTYSIIKKHKGHLEIESKLGKGTKFTIYLPASKNEVIKKEQKSEIIISKKHHSAKILIMDDEEAIRKMSSQMIKVLGYEADSASDGKQAIMKYEDALKQNKPFDIILMDLTIPGGMGGKEAVKKILEINKKAKVIVSSGYASGPVMSDYKAIGFIDMIAKPYTIANLKEVINRVLNGDLG